MKTNPMKKSSLHAILTPCLTLCLTLCIALLAAFALVAEADTGADAAANQPQAVVEEPVYDAGKVTKGEEVSYDFVIRNTGDAPLKIEEVRPACGCTVADYDETIAPGASGKIHAVVDTTDFTGGISKGMTVITNDPANPRLVLTVKADVSPSVYLRPGFARFVQTQKSAPGKVEQIIFTKDMEDLEIVKIESPYEFLNVEARKATEDEVVDTGIGNQYVVTLTLDYDVAPIGSLAEYVRLHTNHPKQEVVSIPVSGFVRPMYVVTPKQADFGRFEVKEDGTGATMMLKNFAEEDMSLALDEAAGLPSGVDVDVSAVEEGREYRVQITLGPELPKGAFDQVIRLKTGLDKQPTIEIPLKGTRI